MKTPDQSLLTPPSLNQATKIRRRRSLFSIFFKATFSLVITWLLLTKVDLFSAINLAKSQNLGFIWFSAVFILAQITGGAWRWQLILQGLTVFFSPLAVGRFYYIGIFFNACLPGGIGGDVVRAWMVSRQSSHPGLVVDSIILDRLTTLGGLGMLILFTMPMLAAKVGHSFPLWLLAVGILLIFMGMILLTYLDRLPQSWRKFPGLNFCWRFAKSSRQLFGQTKLAIGILTLAVGTQIAMSLSVYGMAQSLNLSLSPLDCLIFMPPVALLATLPISLGGWGIREAAMISFLGIVGIPASAALILSVQFGLLTILLSLPGGILWLIYRERQPISRQ